MLRILLAPLQLLTTSGDDDKALPGSIVVEDSDVHKAELRNRIECYSGATTLAYLTVGSVIAISLIFVGAYLALFGSEGSVTISGAGIEVSTDNLGFGFAALGAVLYLSVGKIAVAKGKA